MVKADGMVEVQEYTIVDGATNIVLSAKRSTKGKEKAEQEWRHSVSTMDSSMLYWRGFSVSARDQQTRKFFW